MTLRLVTRQSSRNSFLPILFDVENFRPYLYGRKFTLVTDHRPLVCVHNIKDPESKLSRWKLRLREYDYVVVYKSGRINANADALSRNPADRIESELEHINTQINTTTEYIDENLTFTDREQILAIKSTVSAPGLDPETYIKDDDYMWNNILITNNFQLFNTNYHINTINHTNANLESSEGDGYETVKKKVSSLSDNLTVNIRTPWERETPGPAGSGFSL